MRLQLAVAFSNLLESEIVFNDGMLRFEHLIFLPVSFQRSRHLFFAGLNALIARLS